VRVTGSTVFQPTDFGPAIQPVVGKTVTLADLSAVADGITKLYLSQGYITSRAVVADQQIVDGVVEIRVLEGSLETIEVTGQRRLPPSYIRDRVRLGVSTPLRQDRLEEQLRLLRSDPQLASVEATLRPGTGLGKSILSVRVKEAPRVYGGASVDNYSPPAVGSERFGIYGGLRNPTGLGDDFSLNYSRTFSGGVNSFDFNYRVPVNPMNGTLQLRVAPSRYRITNDALSQGFDISGRSALYEASFRQPLVRSLRQELAVSLGFALQDGNSTIGGTNLFDTNSRVRVLKFGQDYLARDPQGAWALRSQFNVGLNVFNATVRDPGTDSADGRFFSWNGSVQRVQRLGSNHLLIAQADLQLSPDALLSSQQFIIGGGQSVRGYRQNARFGDNGWRFSVEDRIALVRNAQATPTVQLAPFFDIGSVWNSGSNPVPTVNQSLLTSAGLGLILQPSDRVTVRLDYAVPFRRVDEKGQNLQDRALYFSVNYQL
jgi:hemolysin activation/secretion protein